MQKFDFKSRRDTELFPRMIFYNRVGKCGSRSVLRLNGLQSVDLQHQSAKFYSIQSADCESWIRTIHLVQHNETAFAEGNALYTAFNETDFIQKMSDISQHIPVVYARHMPFVDFDKAPFFPAMPRILKLIKITLCAFKIILRTCYTVRDLKFSRLGTPVPYWNPCKDQFGSRPDRTVHISLQFQKKWRFYKTACK